MMQGDKFESLESKIQGLIASHQQLKAENNGLKKENEELLKALEAEKARIKWVEDGYASLQQAEKKNKDKSVSHLQKKLEDIISEVERNIELIDTNITK
jgi:predicted nuclease with TOPRIM domain